MPKYTTPSFPQELLNLIEQYWEESEEAGVADSAMRKSVRPHLSMFFRWTLDEYEPKSKSRQGSNDIHYLRNLLP